MSDARETIRRIHEDAIGQGQAELIDELFHPEFVNHTAQEWEPPDRSGVEMVLDMLQSAFSDTEATVHRVVVDGDQVAWRWTLRGVHTGELLGIPPSGNRVEMAFNDLGTLRDGQLAELWTETDMLSLMTQLGALEGASG